MRVLISNDDGIDSRGIFELARAFKEIAEVTVVAPLREQSAVGHAITIQHPLRVIEFSKKENFFGHAVDGTPADCVKMGVRNIMDAPPDVVVSGINHGSNTAINVIYSGTVSAAREAASMDFPAVAVSITSRVAKHLDVAAHFAVVAVQKLAEMGFPKGVLLNVNVPDLPLEEIKGVVYTRMGDSKWDDVYEKRQDPTQRDYYWLTGKLVELDTNLDYDHYATTNNYVSITPLRIDQTDHDLLSQLKKQ